MDRIISVPSLILRPFGAGKIYLGLVCDKDSYRGELLFRNSLNQRCRSVLVLRVDVGLMGQEQLDDRLVAARGGIVQRGFFGAVSGIHLCPVLEKQLDHTFETLAGCQVQRCRSIVIDGLKAGFPAQQQINHRLVAVGGGNMQRCPVGGAEGTSGFGFNVRAVG